MLTVKDIRKSTVTGFSHVGFVGGPSRSNTTSYYQAFAKGGRKGDWKGPRRSGADEAAQDYCDFINGLAPAQQPKQPKPVKLARNLQRAQHPTRRTTAAAPTKARRPSPLVRARPGFVYLIGILREADAVKIGWSSSPGFPRLNELQTGNPNLLVGLAEFAGTLDDEYRLHCRYESDNILNEWFRVSDELLAEFDLTLAEFNVAVDAAEVETA